MAKKETPFERRMRELEEEAERIQASMESLERAASRKPSRDAGPPRPKHLGRLDSRRVSSTALGDRPDEDTGDAIEGEDDPVSDARNLRPAAEPSIMASYLSSGSFGKGVSMSRERRIVRNKAIFTLVVAVVLGFIVYHWLFS